MGGGKCILTTFTLGNRRIKSIGIQKYTARVKQTTYQSGNCHEKNDIFQFSYSVGNIICRQILI